MRILAITFVLAASLCAGIARANCGPLIDALDKVDQQPRFAMYDIDSRDQPLTGNRWPYASAR